ncbi:MAG TPA: SDR family oxidoreductase [Acidimicrobiia bacterium]|jgi:NAD(P)-dependent dehydrogenase (short-subunit alcohol dehydrogenase family)
MGKVLITGCSTGIGRAAAVELTKRGHEVVATARRPETLDDLDVAARLRLDVDDDASVRDAVSSAGAVDALVNNAGFGVVGPVETLPLDEVARMFQTNVFGAWRMIQAVVPGMRARGSGTIVNVTSLAGRVSAPLNGAYSASKYALEALSEALHYEVGHFGIRVAMIEPGRFTTNFGARELRLGIDSPYDELDLLWQEAQEKLPTGADPGAEPPGPEAVAAAIADAIETSDTPLRVPVGTDAELVISTRASMDDATFEATMRGVLGLDW